MIPHPSYHLIHYSGQIKIISHYGKNHKLNATSVCYMKQTISTAIDSYSPFNLSVHPQLHPTNQNTQKNAQFLSLHHYITAFFSKNPCIKYNQETDNIFIIGEFEDGSYQGHIMFYNITNNYFEIVDSFIWEC